MESYLARLLRLNINIVHRCDVMLKGRTHGGPSVFCVTLFDGPQLEYIKLQYVRASRSFSEDLKSLTGEQDPPPPYSSLVFKTLLSNNIFLSGVGGDQNRGQTRVSIGLVWSGSTSGVWRILTCRIVITVLVCNRVIKHNRAWMEYRDTSTAFSRK